MSERLSVKEKVLSAIDQLAAETRERLVGQGIFRIKMIMMFLAVWKIRSSTYLSGSSLHAG